MRGEDITGQDDVSMSLERAPLTIIATNQLRAVFTVWSGKSMAHEAKMLPAVSVGNYARESLAYGQFYGTVEQRHEVQRFSVALITADEKAVAGAAHSHECAHLIFMLEGQYVCSVRGGERLIPLRSLIFVPAGTTHKDRLRTQTTRTLTVSVADSQIEQARDYVRLPEIQADFRYGEITFLAGRLAAECRGWRTSSALTAEGLCLELLAAVARRNETKERVPPRWLRVAREMLQERCLETVSISEIAAEVGIHPIHLSRTFRQFFHCTPGDYLRDCRLETAARLLRSAHTSIHCTGRAQLRL